MKKLLVTVLVITVVMCLFIGMLSGCASISSPLDEQSMCVDNSKTNSNDDKEYHKTLVIVSKEISFTWGAYCLRDTETGVEYWFVKSGYGAWLTPRLNPDGSYRTYNDQTAAEDNE